MLKKILIAIIAIVAVFFGYVAVQPSEFRVVREIVIDAPAERIFPHVNDLKKFHVWNPYSKVDLEAKYSFSGASEGPGAVSEWDGNSDAGAGKMIITEIATPNLVRMDLQFVRPFEGTNQVEFRITPDASGGTRVAWDMNGKSNFVSRLFCVFVDLDKMVGKDFEKGLATLKGMIEENRSPQSS